MQLTHMQIPHGRAETGMTQQPADRQQIDSRFQQMGGEAVTQSVRRDVVEQSGFHGRCFADFLNGRLPNGTMLTTQSRGNVVRKRNRSPQTAWLNDDQLLFRFSIRCN